MTDSPAQSPTGRPQAIRRSAHLAFAIPAALSIGLFAWMITYGTWHVVANDVFGNFYDYQALAWLHGRWDVPEPALSGEAFLRDGKVYGYFGPTPALLRVPLVAANVAFGETTRLWMSLHYAAGLVAAYLLLLERASARGTRLPRWLVVTYVFAVGLGSTLFFLGSRAYVYHEAILAGVNFSLWSTLCALRYLRAAPGATRLSPWLALAFGLLALHARAPTGLFALTFLTAAALALAFRARRSAHVRVAAAAVVAIASFNAVSYIKFRTFEGCPLRLNVQYTPEKLAALGNTNFHWSNLRFNSAAYLFVASASIHREFPFVFLEFIDRKKYPESRMAYRDATLAVPYAMPGLTILALASLVALRRGTAGLASSDLLLWLAALPFSLALLTAVAVTQRYTADFCAVLIPAGAVGTTYIGQLAARPHRLIGGIAVAGTAVAMFVQFAITLHYQRAVVWGVPDSIRAEYQAWTAAIDRRLKITQSR